MEVCKIERFNGKNFRTRKRRITYILIHKKTHYVITAPRPENSLVAQKKWDEANALARASILISLKDDIVPLYEEVEHAKEILDADERSNFDYLPIYYIAFMGFKL